MYDTAIWKGDVMKLKMLCKDAGSGGSGCPSVYIADNGDFVVQGHVLDADTEGNLENVLPGESAVSISPEIVLEAVRLYAKK
jgi:hypothetical protein